MPDNGALYYAIGFGLLLFAMGLYAYVGRSAPRFWIPTIWQGYPSTQSTRAIPMLMPAGLGFACVCLGLLLLPVSDFKSHRVPILSGLLEFGGFGLICVGIVAGVWSPRFLWPWWLKESSPPYNRRGTRRSLTSELDSPPPARRRGGHTGQQPSAAYEERRRITAANLMMGLASAVFTLGGVFGGVIGMPLWTRVLTVAFFGGGAALAIGRVAMGVRRVALRVDNDGVTLCQPWPRRPVFTPWAQVLSIWLWNTGPPYLWDFVGVKVTDPDPRRWRAGQRVARRTGSVVDADVAGYSIGIDGWHLEVSDLVSAVRRYGPEVAVLRARPDEPPEVLSSGEQIDYHGNDLGQAMQV